MADLLFEAGMEEIPARMIAAAEAELTERVVELLRRERLLGEEHEVHSYSTPRRLAVQVNGVLARQPDATREMTGPAWSVAFKEGQPTAAGQAFARKAGVDVSGAGKNHHPEGRVCCREGAAERPCRCRGARRSAGWPSWPLSTGRKICTGALLKPERFVRPVRWMVALLDHAVIPLEFGGVQASNQTFGHRILHGNAPLSVDHPDDYLGVLESASVTADVQLRRHRIRKALDLETRSVPGARWREDAALVETVTHLTEWPSVVLGGFDREYLELPDEVLVTVMRDHQKYFAVENAQGKLEPYFLAVLNTHPEEMGIDVIRHGNERVLRARFNDARFFWRVDQKTPLEDRVEMLKSVTFHKELGSYWDKTQANLDIAERLAALLVERGVAVDTAALRQAVLLAKTDLTTELVKEFTELQGIVGGLYARAQSLGETVAQAIYWQYSPAAIEDPIPPTVEGQVLGIADRIQTIVAMFGIGLDPTGSKDPFALRRAANAIVKILAETGLPLVRSDLFRAVPTGCAAGNPGKARRLLPRAPGVLAARSARFLLRRGQCRARRSLRQHARRHCPCRGPHRGPRIGRPGGHCRGLQTDQKYPAPGGREGHPAVRAASPDSPVDENALSDTCGAGPLHQEVDELAPRSSKNCATSSEYRQALETDRDPAPPRGPVLR